MCHLERDSMPFMTTRMEDYITKSDLILDHISDLWKSYMSRLNTSSNREHLGFGRNNLNLEEDGGMWRRTSVMGATKNQG